MVKSHFVLFKYYMWKIVQRVSVHGVITFCAVQVLYVGNSAVSEYSW